MSVGASTSNSTASPWRNFLMSNVLRLINICVVRSALLTLCSLTCCHDAIVPGPGFLIGRLCSRLGAVRADPWGLRNAHAARRNSSQKAIAYFIKLPQLSDKTTSTTTTMEALFCHNNSLHKMLTPKTVAKESYQKQCETFDMTHTLRWPRLACLSFPLLTLPLLTMCWHWAT